MDVNLSEERITESPEGNLYQPGMGGWPTIRYFNQETGMKGGSYVKKTEKAVCDELGDENMMTAYVEEYGKTSLCSVETEKGCGEREVDYMRKMKESGVSAQKAQLERLEKMEDSSSSMKTDLHLWVKQRKEILKNLLAVTTEEL